MPSPIQSLGIIAGNRALPRLFAREARRAGVRRLVAVAFEGETDPALAAEVDEIVWIRVGQLSKMISAFTSRGIQHCVMLGQIAPNNLYDVRPDLRAMGLLLKLREKNAQTIFGAIAQELNRDGVELIEPLPWLRPFLPETGFHFGPPLTTNQQADLALGFRIAKEVSRLEIGQSVVVKDGTVLAVEGFEGTDACLARGGDLGGTEGAAVAVKVAKANHDMRFDIPCVGPQTLETCARHRIAVFAMESGKSLLLEREAVEEICRAHALALTVAG